MEFAITADAVALRKRIRRYNPIPRHGGRPSSSDLVGVCSYRIN